MSEESTKSVNDVITEKLIDFASNEVEVVSVIETDANKAQVKLHLSPKADEQNKASLSTQANALAVSVIKALGLKNAETQSLQEVSKGVFIMPLLADFESS